MEKDSYEEVKKNSFSEKEQITVSVAMIAYNVGKYIEEAIESVLNQKTNYRVQLVIGEDCSLDNTREIALAYQKRYPQIIKVLLPEKNQGLTPNCIATINACEGKYVALLDSDDYWTTTDKLQTQISFLEENPEYSGSGHQSMKIYDDKSAPESLFGEELDCDFGLVDTLSHRKFHTSSFVFRKKYWDKTGGIPKTISSNERALYPMIAIFGKIRYYKESMCVYRFSGFGLSSRINYKELETDMNMLPWLKKINKKFPTSQFRSFLHLCMFTYGKQEMPILPLFKHYFLFCFFSFSRFPHNLGDVKHGTLEFLKKIK